MKKRSDHACRAWAVILGLAAMTQLGRAEPGETPPKDHPIAPRFTLLRLGEIKPTGWIQEQMLRDLKVGFAGHLNELTIEANKDIFASGQLKGPRAAENVSHPIDRDVVVPDPDAKAAKKWKQPDWWSGETEGNWRTGYILMAYLSGDKEAMAKADAWVNEVLAAQDISGYMGIHCSPGLRYAPGELWTQACLMRGLLDYYELTGRDDVLRAVERAADLTIRTTDPAHGTKPMQWKQTHDLMFSDVVERLYDFTGDPKYRDYGVALYDSYSNAVRKDDTSLPMLLNPDAGFTGHGAHAYEHIRVPLWLYYATGRSDLGQAWKNALIKTQHYTYPGEASVSQENINNLPPDPTLTEFEYCPAKEIQWDLELGVQKTGEPSLADEAEQLWFNDEQAARAVDGSGLTYLTSENRFYINRTAQDGKGANGKGRQPRNVLSPIGGGVACCCPPNATQVAALYVRGMWMREGDDGLAAVLYGPCTVSSKVGDTSVKIEEKTNYPFASAIDLAIDPDKPARFTLRLRDPGWSKGTEVTAAGAEITREGRYWKVSKTWARGDSVHVAFAPSIFQVHAVNGEVALQYGALLYALPIASTKTSVKTYPIPGFADYLLMPSNGLPNLSFPDKRGDAAFGFKPRLVTSDVNPLRPFDASPIVLDGSMVDPATDQAQHVTLVPLGEADELRRLTFPVYPKASAPLPKS